MTGRKPRRGVPPNDTSPHYRLRSRQKHPTDPRHPNRVDKHLPSRTDEMSNGPVRNYRYIAMFDRVKVHVVQMARIISLVPNSMLPKTSLPDATLHPQRARQGPSGSGQLCWRSGTRPWPWLSPFAIRINERPSVAAAPVQNEFSLL